MKTRKIGRKYIQHGGKTYCFGLIAEYHHYHGGIYRIDRIVTSRKYDVLMKTWKAGLAYFVNQLERGLAV